MGIFSKIEINGEDVKKINSLLPEHIKRTNWSENNFKNDNIYVSVDKYIKSLKTSKDIIKEEIKDFERGRNQKLASKINIFNTEVYNAKPLGMVDYGVVVRFNASSTGNRFENDLIGYAIEGAIDEVWANNNAQYDLVSNAKLKLLQKAISIYPNCNLLFKFEIDFRELGSSGNVFLYLRGTACKGINDLLDKYKKEISEEISEKILELENSLIKIDKELEELSINLKKIPKSKSELIDFLKTNIK